MVPNSSHYIALKKSYEKVGNEINNQDDFNKDELLN